MKTNVYAMIIAVLIGSFILFLKQAQATEFRFYPRIETGVMRYSIKHSALANATLSFPGQSSGANKTRKTIEFSDDMNVVGGGATFFINQFYIDMSGQYAFEGSDRAHVMYSTYEEVPDNLTSYLTNRYVHDVEFDHKDKAIAVGYAVSRSFSVFAGYKWDNRDFDSTSDGDIFHFYPEDNIFLKSLIQQEMQTRFKYEGPFIGATQGWEIDTLQYLKGLLSVKLALALLNSKYTIDQKNTMTLLIGTEVYSVESWDYHAESKGDSWGFSLGMGWRGNTPIRNLSYSIQIDGYRYNFESDDADLGDISETVLNYKAGITYAF
jgi:hypothetical protein